MERRKIHNEVDTASRNWDHWEASVDLIGELVGSGAAGEEPIIGSKFIRYPFRFNTLTLTLIFTVNADANGILQSGLAGYRGRILAMTGT